MAKKTTKMSELKIMPTPDAERNTAAAGHGKVHATLGRRIACGHHYPIVREVVFTEFAVEHQLIAARLGHLRRQSARRERGCPCRR
jgi:hypothetical protein